MIILDIPIEYYLCSFLSAFVLYFTMQTKGRNTIKIVGFIFSKKNDAPIIIIDSIITSILGAIISTLIMQPLNPQQAIISGLGWTALVNGFGSISDKDG